MKAQTPAVGISERNLPGDIKCYEIQCECSSTGHEVVAWIEIEAEDDLATLIFYIEPYTPYTVSWKERLKMVWDIVTKGQYKLCHEVILKEQAALNISVALQKAINDLDRTKNTTVI